jgi:hypothetical protein
MPIDASFATEPAIDLESSDSAPQVDARHDPIADRCASLRRAQSRTRVALALTIAAFTRIDGPRWLAYASQRDYARGRLEVPWATFARYRRLGCFLSGCPDIRAAVAAGELKISVADEVALRANVETAARLLPRLLGQTVRQVRAILSEPELHTEPEHSRPEPCESERRTSTEGSESQPIYERVAFSVPPAVAHYVHQSLELASAFSGTDLSESDCVEAVVAEASTEIPLTSSAEEARQRFRAPRRRTVPRPRPVALPQPPRPRFRQDDRSAALVLDRRLERLIKRQGRLESDLEDALLQLHTAGNLSLPEFAREVLDLPRSTLSDHLQRARQRRRGDPIAKALAEGVVTPVKAQLLHRLRRCHVPTSSLGPWVELAQRCTTRRLDRMIRWARMQGDLDYRAWSLAGCPPPTPDQLRTSNQPVEDVAADPRPEWLLQAEQTPQSTVTWVLAEETLDLLLQLMAAVETRHQEGTFDPVPAWWCLLRVFVTARDEWAVIERPPNTLARQILRRDGYRCCAPHCSQRRNLQVHHIRFRSAGGMDVESNLVTLCAFHHTQSVHQNLMRVRGQVTESSDDLTFEIGLHPSGQPTEVYRREEAV